MHNRGKVLRDMPNVDYLATMGASVITPNMRNTGIDFETSEIYKWFRVLRNYYLNKFRWSANCIRQPELNMIEWYLFHYGTCAMIQPKVVRNGVILELSPRIFKYASVQYNTRTMAPLEISVVQSGSAEIMSNTYKKFVIFKDTYGYTELSLGTFCNLAWEYACKLYELDLMFNANSHKMRFPIVFNKKSQVKDKDQARLFSGLGTGLAEIFKGAFNRHEVFVEVDSAIIPERGLVSIPDFPANYTSEYIETQKRLIESYMELLGLSIDRDRKGSYTVARIQETGSDVPNYVTQTMMYPRLLSMKECSRIFGIDIEIQVI